MLLIKLDLGGQLAAIAAAVELVGVLLVELNRGDQLLIELDLGDPLATIAEARRDSRRGQLRRGRLIELDLDDQLAAIAARSGGTHSAIGEGLRKGQSAEQIAPETDSTH